MFPKNVRPSSVVILCSLLTVLTLADDDSNKLWVLINNTNLLTCSGPPNQFTLTKDDVSVTDKTGQPVKILEAPGEYFVKFDNIKVLRQLPNLSGRLGSTLQVPLVSSSFVRLDFPYQIIPQNTVLEGFKCDNESGYMYDGNDKRHYCRYCSLCDTSTHVENKISTNDLGFKYAPNLKSEGSFDRVCRNIDSQTYSIKRSVILPDKKELEQEANDRYKGTLEGAVQQKLNVGTGRLQVFLNVDSNSDAPADANQWYANNKSCSCCVKDQAGSSNCQRSLIEYALGRKSQKCLSCNNEYVKTCLKGSTQRVGCYIVEYNFRVTDKRSEYEAFKKTIEGQDQGSGSPSSSQASQQQTSSSSQNGSGPQACGACDIKKCVSSIGRPDSARFCKDADVNSGKRNYCCAQCPSICLRPPTLRRQVQM